MNDTFKVGDKVRVTKEARSNSDLTLGREGTVVKVGRLSGRFPHDVLVEFKGLTTGHSGDVEDGARSRWWFTEVAREYDGEIEKVVPVSKFKVGDTVVLKADGITSSGTSVIQWRREHYYPEATTFTVRKFYHQTMDVERPDGVEECWDIAAFEHFTPEVKADPELVALEGLVKALSGLDADAARRVLGYGYKRFTL